MKKEWKSRLFACEWLNDLLEQGVTEGQGQ